MSREKAPIGYNKDNHKCDPHYDIQLIGIDHISSDGMVVAKAKCDECGEEYQAHCYPSYYKHTKDATGWRDIKV